MYLEFARCDILIYVKEYRRHWCWKGIWKEFIQTFFATHSILRNIRHQEIIVDKVTMQGKLFQRCTHLLYCSVLSLGGNLNTSRMSKPHMGSIFHTKNQWNILVTENFYVNYQNYQNLMLLSSSDTKRTLMHLFLYTNSAQRELVSIYIQSIRNCN